MIAENEFPSIQEFKFNRIVLNWIEKKYEEFPDESGIYQIYGTSPLYGINTLIYIGKANSLKHRIKTHLGDTNNVIGRQPNLSCRYALVPKNYLTIVEQILIVMNKPSFNSASLKNIHPDIRKKIYYIQNHGSRGILGLEVSSFYFYTGQVEKDIDHLIQDESQNLV